MQTTAPPALHLDRETLLNLDRSLSREWLETDGLGGYASSTVVCCPTRRYHGLLVGYPPGSSKRHNFLSRFEESFHGGGKQFSISISRYPGLFHPLGHQGIERFDLAPWPAWVYQFGSARLERDVLMVKGQPIVLVRYRVNGQRSAVELRLRPLLPMREADALTFENEALDRNVETLSNGIRLRPYAGLPSVSITASAAAPFHAEPCWFKNQEYRTDLARGYEGHEDNYSPGTFHIALQSGVDVVIAATIGAAVADPAALWREESARRLAEAGDGSLRSVMKNRASDFLYRTPTGRLGVIAGYPWFGEWGRDAYISLPGLTLAGDQIEASREALQAARSFLWKGLMPNIFGHGIEDSQYNSADASLWFARAVLLHARAAGSESIAELRPALESIAEHYSQGTELGLSAREDGLLYAGSREHNITWMDARTAQGPVTPRAGAPVEINALWYSLLAHLEEWAKAQGDTAGAQRWRAQRLRTGQSFLQRFWCEEGYLADVVQQDGVDRSVRPNMVIAAALEFSPLSRAQRAAIVALAQAQLVTPCGLRTLAPGSEGYQARYAGSGEQRDQAYHQGTVWPWLLGFYIEAGLRAHGPRAKETLGLQALLDGFAAQLSEAGLNHISEVFDAQAPHRPGGTIAQAWNTAEWLRAQRMLDDGLTDG